MVKYRATNTSFSGFTLIELMAVLAIVSVLLLLVTPRYYAKVDAARDAVLLENLRTVRTVIGNFYQDTGRYPESLGELVERKYLVALPIDPVLESDSQWTVVPPPVGYEGAVYDIRSSAAGNGVNGLPYANQ